MSRCSEQQAQYLSDLKKQYTAFTNAILKLDTKLVKEYTIGDRTFQFHNLKELHEIQEKLNGQICKLQVGRGVRTQRVIPLIDT